MNKKFKVIQLNGLSGLMLLLLLVLGVVGSFAVLPVYAVKFLWNEFVNLYLGAPQIRLAQAALLWFAVLSIVYGYLKKRVQFKFVNTADFSDNNIRPVDYEKFIEQIKKEQQNDEKINR